MTQIDLKVCVMLGVCRAMIVNPPAKAFSITVQNEGGRQHSDHADCDDEHERVANSAKTAKRLYWSISDFLM